MGSTYNMIEASLPNRKRTYLKQASITYIQIHKNKGVHSIDGWYNFQKEKGYSIPFLLKLRVEFPLREKVGVRKMGDFGRIPANKFHKHFHSSKGCLGNKYICLTFEKCI